MGAFCLIFVSGSPPGAISIPHPTPLRRHLTMSGDVFGGHSRAVGGAMDVCGAEALDAAKHPPMHRAAPQQGCQYVPRMKIPAVLIVLCNGCCRDDHFIIRRLSFRNWASLWHPSSLSLTTL